MIPRPLLALATVLALACSACSERATPVSDLAGGRVNPLAPVAVPVEPGVPGPQGWDDYYPLVPGTTWRLEHSFTLRLIPDDGTPTNDGEGWYVERSIACETQHDGRSYLVEVQADDFGAGPIPSGWVRYRQDATGLYEANVAVSLPACTQATEQATGDPVELRAGSPVDASWRRMRAEVAAHPNAATLDAAWRSLRSKLVAADRIARGAGVAGDELVRLQYPLHPGASWVVNPEIDFISTVTRRFMLDVPAGRFAAWETRYTSPIFGADDDVRFWWSHQGLLGYQASFSGEWIDEAGNHVGTVEGVILERLAEISVAP